MTDKPTHEHRPVNVYASAEAEEPPDCSCGAHTWCLLPAPRHGRHTDATAPQEGADTPAGASTGVRAADDHTTKES